MGFHLLVLVEERIRGAPGCHTQWCSLSRQGKARWPPNSALHSIKGRFVMQQTIATDTSADVVVVPTQKPDVLDSNPNPTLPERHQSPATMLPSCRLPVCTQLGSGSGTPTTVSKGVSNLKSAVEFYEVIDYKIAKELVLGRILGLYDVPPSSYNFRVSPLGVIPKKTHGEFTSFILPRVFFCK